MTRSEAYLRDALAGLLETDPKCISLIATFSEHGLDSLLGLRFARRIQELIEDEFELEWMFDYPTIRDLAHFLDHHCMLASSHDLEETAA